jgi:ATP-dependent helicase/nuclease subunit B
MERTRRLFVSGSFAVLEQAAIQAIRTLKASADPLAPLWVVVPTNLLRVHLARGAAGAGPGFANLRVLTLLDLARELAETTLHASGKRLVSDVAARALVRRVAARQPLRYFRELVDQPGFHAALLATFDDLANGEVEPGALLEHVAVLSPDSGSTEKLDEIGRLYRAFRDEIQRLGLFERNDLLRTAAVRAGEQCVPGERIVLYGFYDLTPLQRRLVAAVTRDADALAFVPWEDSPRFAYATATLSWWRSNRFDLLPLRTETTSDTDLERAQTRLFDPVAGAEASTLGDGSIRILSCPGEVREAREVARAVLQLVRKRSLKFSEIGVLLRARTPYLSLISDALEHAGVPVYREGGRPLAETRAGRALLLLLRALEEDFARPTVSEFLAIARPHSPVSADGAPEDYHPTMWDAFSAEAGVVQGSTQWRSRLAVLRRRYERRRLGEDEPSDRLVRRIEQVEHCERFMERFLSALDAVPREGGWGEILARLADVFERYVEQDADAGRVRDAVAALAQIESVVGEASLTEVAVAVARALQTASKPVGQFGGGVFVGEVMQARGLPLRAVIIPGLVERGIPAPIREDPLLVDDERSHLGERSAFEVPEKQRGHDEEKLLFTLMLGGASDCAVLTFPRLDLATARERLPSFYLLQVCSAVTGLRFHYGDLDAWRLVERIGLSQLFPASLGDVLDPREAGMLLAHEAVEREDAATLRGFLGAAPFFRAACRAERARWGTATFTPYDGVLESVRATARLAAREWVVSARLLQAYLRCPYRFFVEHVLGVAAAEEPERVGAVSPRDRGLLVHEILRAFFDRAAAEGLATLRAYQPRAHELMEEIATRRLAEFEAEGLIGLPALWQNEKEALQKCLRDFVAAEVETANDFIAARLELGFGDGDRVVHLRLGDGGTVRLRGRIDRLDFSRAGGGRVIDYKTGQVSTVATEAIGPENVQLSFYLHAARILFPERAWEGAEFYYVGPRGQCRREMLASSEPAAQEAALAETVERVLRGIRSGWFPAGAPSCKRCSFVPVCGRSTTVFAAKLAGHEVGA